jgi:diaminohydroxyphosphoribosylaminopyrimidine deaminase/5-amino-6-(5-phosphoribosylamino)uracil reductase
VNQTQTVSDATWMTRCFDLARQGIGYVSPNPAVGAVLVHNNRILSEGYHGFFGGPHAEVVALRNVRPEDRHLIPESTLYVSLEPCCITGKTPPCTDLIIREGIRDVRISTLDPNPAVSGSGLNRLRERGINVTTGILEAEGKALIRPFTTNILLHRPHVILKWAQSRFGYSGKKDEQVWLSDPVTKTWSHSQRAKVDAVMVGARTVALDNPSLTTRDYPGRSPHRVVFDPNGRLEQHYNVFNADGKLVYYFSAQDNPAIEGRNIRKHILSASQNTLQEMLDILYADHVGIVLIEGGPYLIRKFVAEHLWDEAWVIKTQHDLAQGITAPDVTGRLIDRFSSGTDSVVGIERVL